MSESPRVQFKLMLPVELKQRLEIEAASNRRSISQEIVIRLEESIDGLARVDIGRISNALSHASNDEADEALDALQSLMDGLHKVKILLERDSHE